MQIYNSTVTQMSACLLSLSVCSLLLPTAFHASWSNDDKADKYTLKVSRGTSVVLLLVYILYILFQLKSHAYLYASIPQRVIDEESHPGVLADLMNSSSDSSSNSSDETDDSAASQSTAKRIKRAVRHRIRKKSSFSSKETVSQKSARRTAVTTTETPVADDGGSNGSSNRDDVTTTGDDSNSAGGNRPDFSVIDFCDEAAYHADDDTTTQFDDDGQRSLKSIDNNNKTTAWRKRDSRGDRRQAIKDDENLDSVAARRKSPLRPFPSVLSNTVFFNPPQQVLGHNHSLSSSNVLRRSSSLPAHMSRAPVPMPPVGNAVQFARANARMPTATSPEAGEPPPLHQPADMSRTAAVVMLLVSTALVAVCAEFLVDAIPQMIDDSPVSQAFVGLIILPVVSNAAEHVTAVSVAAKNKMDLAIGVSVGSSIQIAIFITPLVVILGWCMNKELSLYFTLFETISLFATAFVVNFLVLDGRSNYLEGALLIAAYVIIA